MNLFTDSKLVYEGRKSLLSELEIRQLLEITGDKINSFIQFYQTYDGVFCVEKISNECNCNLVKILFRV